MTTLLKNGKLIDCKTNTEDYFDILIENNEGDIKIYNKKYSKIIKK